MRKTNSLLCLTVLAVSVSWSFGGQDVTKSSYFARAVFGAGSSSTIGTCNTTTTAVTERVIFRDAATGQILEDEQGQLAVSDHRKTYFFGLSPTGHRSRQPRLWRGIGGNGSVQRLNRPQIEHRQRVGERRGAGELIVPPP